MTEINQPDSILAIGQQYSDQKKRESEHRSPYADSSKKEHQKVLETGEVASILGISAGAVNSEIQHAVSDLLNQLDWLRKHLEEVTHRKNYLEQVADRHSRAEVFNRHALLRELNRRMEHAERIGLDGSAALVHIPGLDDIRLQYGLSAADSLLQQVCMFILAQCRAGDVAGLISDQDVIVVLPLKDRQTADSIVAKMCEEIRSHDFAVDDTFFSFELLYSVCSYTEDSSAKKVIDKLDAALIGNMGDD